MTHITCHIERGHRQKLEDCCRGVVIKTLGPAANEIVILAVLDGVGGNNGGDIASRLGADYIVSELSVFFTADAAATDHSSIAADTVTVVLSEVLARANQLIVRRAGEVQELSGMASTVVTAVIVDGIIYVAWAGDSRCYLYRDGSLRRITRDHKEIETLIELGLIEREQARDYPLVHTINRYLGQPEGFAHDTRVCRIRPDDVSILCSDGLTDVVTDEQIACEITACQAGKSTFNELPARLVDMALAGGTQDNVSVLACEYHASEHTGGLVSEHTLTGAYPDELANTLHHLIKENEDV